MAKIKEDVYGPLCIQLISMAFAARERRQSTPTPSTNPSKIVHFKNYDMQRSPSVRLGIG